MARGGCLTAEVGRSCFRSDSGARCYCTVGVQHKRRADYYLRVLAAHYLKLIAASLKQKGRQLHGAPLDAKDHLLLWRRREVLEQLRHRLGQILLLLFRFCLRIELLACNTSPHKILVGWVIHIYGKLAYVDR